jgi:hypothetical protein
MVFDVCRQEGIITSITITSTGQSFNLEDSTLDPLTVAALL